MERRLNLTLWASFPLVFVLVFLALLAAINWPYAAKLFFPDHAFSTLGEVYLGPTLLAIALGLAIAAGLALLTAQILWPKDLMNWFFVPFILVTLFLIFPSLFLVLTGPAAVTMKEQMQAP